MPNRIIRESCRTSKTLDRLSADAERCCWRLTTVADDYGRFEADAVLVKSSCFPLKETLKSATVERWLLELATGDDPMIVLYQVGAKRYGQFLTWDKHQTVRAKHSKYPEPTDANICTHLLADVSQCPRIRIRERNAGTRTPHAPHGADAEAVDFDAFWTAYPKKKDKADALKAWRKLQPDHALVSQILRAIAEQRQSSQWQRDGGEYIPYPSSWLNGKRWQDEAPPTDAVRDLEARLLHGH